MSGPARTAPLQALLGVLRPRPGMELTHGLICTYSVDLVVVAAALAALAGFGGEGTQVSRVSLARSVRELRGRLVIRAQAGRVKAPPALGPFHALLLDFVRTTQMPIPGQHWHPKFIVVRFGPADDPRGAPEWRIWLGSHNLVRSTSWELGGSVASQRGGRRIPGLNDQVVRAFSEHADPLPAGIAEEARSLRWDAGEPTPVHRLDLLGEATPRWRVAPGASEAVVVSPFLDADALSWLTGELPARRRLVTSREELGRLAALRGATSEAAWADLSSFEVVAVGAPAEEPSSLSFEVAGSDDDGDDDRGVHAKALFLRRGAAEWSLQFGSANATRRGLALRGVPANAEVVSEVRISETDRAALLQPVLDRAQRLSQADLVALRAEGQRSATVGEQDVHQLLADLVATWAARQRCSEGEVMVVSDAPPTIPEGHVLGVATLLATHPLREWVRGAATLALPGASPAETSDYLLVELRGPGSEGLTARTLMRAPADPPRDDVGDLALLRRALGPRGLLEWLRGRLDGIACDDVDWDSVTRPDAAPGSAGRGTSPASPSFDLCIEDVLRAYARDQARGAPAGGELAALDRDMGRLDLAKFAQAEENDTVEDRHARARLARFLETWSRVRRTLLPGGAR